MIQKDYVATSLSIEYLSFPSFVVTYLPVRCQSKLLILLVLYILTETVFQQLFNKYRLFKDDDHTVPTCGELRIGKYINFGVMKSERELLSRVNRNTQKQALFKFVHWKTGWLCYKF